MKALGKYRELWLGLAILLVLVLVTARFPRFAQPNNLLTIFNDTSILMMLALGQMAVILTRSVDLSVAGMTLGSLKEVVRRCDLMVTNDTGPRHVAAALGVPVVTVFGPTFPEWTDIYYKAERLVSIPVFCGPCQKKVCPLDHRCMTGVTPAMVGRYLQALEDRLGARLLNRTTQTQSLTEAGAAFYPHATAALDALEEAERAASAGQAEPHGLLRVAAPMSFGIRHLASAVAEFCRLYPGVRVELALNDRVVDLVDEGYDVAVRIGRLAASSLRLIGMIAIKVKGQLASSSKAPISHSQLRLVHHKERANAPPIKASAPCMILPR